MLNGFGEASSIERDCKKSINDFGVRAVFNPVNMASPMDIARMVEVVRQQFGRVDKARAELLSEKQPSHGFPTPEQIGALTVFLCSEAALQIRGAALPIDGGWTAQ